MLAMLGQRCTAVSALRRARSAVTWAGWWRKCATTPPRRRPLTAGSSPRCWAMATMGGGRGRRHPLPRAAPRVARAGQPRTARRPHLHPAQQPARQGAPVVDHPRHRGPPRRGVSRRRQNAPRADGWCRRGPVGRALAVGSVRHHRDPANLGHSAATGRCVPKAGGVGVEASRQRAHGLRPHGVASSRPRPSRRRSPLRRRPGHRHRRGTHLGGDRPVGATPRWAPHIVQRADILLAAHRHHIV